jgi:hypothetical protein
MKNSSSILRPMVWSLLLLAAFFSFMYYQDHVHMKQIEDEKLVFSKTQAAAENERKIYGRVSDTTQRKLDSLQKDISTIEHAR